MTLAGKEVMDIKKGVADIEKGVTHARKDMMPIRRAEQGPAPQPSSCRGHRAPRMALVGSGMARSCGDRPPQLSHTCPRVEQPDKERCLTELLPSAQQQYPPLVLELWLMSFHRVLYK